MLTLTQHVLQEAILNISVRRCVRVCEWMSVCVCVDCSLFQCWFLTLYMLQGAVSKGQKTSEKWPWFTCNKFTSFTVSSSSSVTSAPHMMSSAYLMSVHSGVKIASMCFQPPCRQCATHDELSLSHVCAFRGKDSTLVLATPPPPTISIVCCHV